MQGRILVIRGGALGDFILTLPVLAALKAWFPETHREILGYSRFTELAVMGGLAHAERPIEARGLAGFFARNSELDSGWADYFASFHLIISYLYDPDGLFQANVARSSRAQFLQGPHRPETDDALHATEVLLQPLERLTIFDADTVPRLSFAAPEPLSAPTDRWLAIHPGSGSEHKNWPEDRFVRLLPRLASITNLKLMLVGGEAEGRRLDRLAAALPPERVEIARDLPLGTLARHLRACAGFLGHDSGITHLAAALGLRGVVLWGPTNSDVWGPRGGTIALLRHPNGLPELAVQCVEEAVRRMLDGGS
jgi:ADP-heptose:LPS heptosyltransferase